MRNVGKVSMIFFSYKPLQSAPIWGGSAAGNEQHPGMEGLSSNRVVTRMRGRDSPDQRILQKTRDPFQKRMFSIKTGYVNRTH